MSLRTFGARLTRNRPVRYSGRGVAATIAIVVGLIVSSLQIDLGPVVRDRAERAASDEISRPVRIGSLKIRILSALLYGQVDVNDIAIAGRSPGDRPLFTAKHIGVSIDWWPAIARRPDITLTSVEMDDWQMLVERWQDGHSFPKRKQRPPSTSRGPRRFQVSVRALHAAHGTFSYVDHEMPFGIVAPNIDVMMRNFPNYNGVMSTSGGTVDIQHYLPMWSNMKARFEIDGDKLRLRRIDLDTDGAKTTAVGEVDMARWPEQSYSVKSRVQFERMREIFFAPQPWALSGDGDFTGTFHLFKGGHELTGRFASPLAGFYAYRFPALYGSLRWNRDGFEIWDAGSDLFGGQARFGLSIAPRAGVPGRTLRFETEYTAVDLERVTDFEALAGVRFAGRASGHNVIEWPLGNTGARTGHGQVSVTPVAGFEPMTASLGDERPGEEWGPFAPVPLPDHLPIAGDLTYAFDPAQVRLSDGRFATGATHATFNGTTEWTERADLAFHVTSADWQESQQVLAGILTDFGSRTGAVTFGGRGQFDGTMTGPFRRPRVEGTLVGEDLRAWDTIWGDGRATIAVENSYVTVTDGLIRRDGSELRANGRFSLSFPRRDQGEELDAVFQVTGRDLDGLRHAFEIDSYPLSGRLSGEFHLTGEYQRPLGFGSMTIDRGTAWGEPFERGTAALRFDGAGVRLDAITLTKASGTMTGAAYVAWDSTYSFNADARRIPMENIEAFKYPALKPSGRVDFTAGGSGTFDDPRYDVTFTVEDLHVADEPVGQVTGRIALRDEQLSGTVDASSPRLFITGTGRIAMTAAADAELTFRFHDSSLDPYVRLFVPRLSQYATAVTTGSVRISGALADFEHLRVDGTVDSLDLRLFDYAIQNARPVRLTLEQNSIRIDNLELVGEGTRLVVDGTVGLQDEQIALRASGDANLNVVQGFFPDVRGSGRAELTATVSGPLKDPQFFGSATITNGGVRYSALPNALDAINGTLRFDARSVRLDDVTARMGGGLVQFGGVVALEGYVPGELNVIVRGENVNLRVPQGVRSTVDAELAVRGNVKAPMLAGTVHVKSAIWNREIDPTGGLFAFGGGDPTGTSDAPATPTMAPFRLDVHVLVPSTLRIENNLVRLIANADLQLRGTSDRPAIFGRAEVERGEVEFEGRRYLVTNGSVDFTNPTRIEPFFDFEAETRVRVPGQTYQVTIRVTGTSVSRLDLTFESDPPLPSADVVALLFSDARRSQGPNELRAMQNPNEREADILTTRFTQLLATPLNTEVGRVVEQTFGIDTFQVSPSLIDPYAQSASPRVNPSARVTIGKRVSDRVYLTFSRSLSTSINDQIVLIEYDESERLSWILSRNEDQTYAIEVRVRHTF